MSRRIPAERQVALYVMGGLVLVVGLAGLVAARSLGLTDAPGIVVVDVADDYMWGRQFTFNPLGGLLTAAIGGLILLTAATRSRVLAFVSATAAAMVAVVSFAQLGAGDQMFAARAGNVALLVASAAALVAIALTPDAPASDRT